MASTLRARATTLDPEAPAGPDGPVAPVAPSVPVAPAAPLAPAGPVDPAAPVGPVGPVGPVAPVTPLAPVAPAGPVGPVFPRGSASTIWLVLVMTYLPPAIAVPPGATTKASISPTSAITVAVDGLLRFMTRPPGYGVRRWYRRPKSARRGWPCRVTSLRFAASSPDSGSWGDRSPRRGGRRSRASRTEWRDRSSGALRRRDGTATNRQESKMPAPA